MSGQHRATPSDWFQVEQVARFGERPDCNCILELRARVEALEAQRPTVQELCQRVDALEAPAEHTTPTPEARPSGLVYRVSAANNAPEAIRAVAAWLREQEPGFLTADELVEAAYLISREADR